MSRVEMLERPCRWTLSLAGFHQLTLVVEMLECQDAALTLFLATPSWWPLLRPCISSAWACTCVSGDAVV